MFLAGPSAPATYVTRGNRRVLLVRPGPAIEPHLLQIERLLPTRLGTRTRRTGARALVARLLLEALGDAGVLVSGRWRRRGTPTRRELARRWLCGELDAEVALPVAVVCDSLGLDAGVLAAAVRAHTAP